MKDQNGNVFIYILIAVVLFGALMFTLSKSASQDDASSELADGNSKIAANEILSFATSASNAIVQMQQADALVSQIDFILPSDVNFNDPPTIYKLFHPDGGGLNYKALPAKANDGVVAAPGAPDSAYYVGRFNTVEWTPSTINDVIFTAYGITMAVCEAINDRVRRDTTIPTIAGESLANLFISDTLHTGTNANFMVTNCAACENIPALCVTDGAGRYAFYSILEAE